MGQCKFSKKNWFHNKTKNNFYKQDFPHNCQKTKTIKKFSFLMKIYAIFQKRKKNRRDHTIKGGSSKITTFRVSSCNFGYCWQSLNDCHLASTHPEVSVSVTFGLSEGFSLHDANTLLNIKAQKQILRHAEQ